MFGLIKPAHVQMRALLPKQLQSDFDYTLASVEDFLSDNVGQCWSTGSKDRYRAIVMGEWILGWTEAGGFNLRPSSQAKVEHLVSLAVRFNERDPTGEGETANSYARDTVAAVRSAIRDASGSQ